MPVTAMQKVVGFFLNDLLPGDEKACLNLLGLDLLFYMHLMSEFNQCSVIKSRMLH